MGFPLFRFTLSNAVEGSLVISEPGGWDSAKMVLERNEEFSSVVELYDQPLMFYGDDGTNNGGIDYIRNIEQTQGIDAQIDLLIEISNDEGDTYETAFEGILDIESIKEIDFYKIECGVNRNDFWRKFINRKGSPVDLLSTTDLDGEAREAINDVTIQLPSQAMRLRSIGSLSVQTTNEQCVIGVSDLSADFDTDHSIQLSFDTFELDEVETRFTLPSSNQFVNTLLTENPNPTFTAKYSGVYTFNELRFVAYGWEFFGVSGTVNETNPDVQYRFYHTDTTLTVYIRINDGTPIALDPENFTTTNALFGAGGVETGVTARWTVWSYDGTPLSLNAGDNITFYADINSTNPGGISSNEQGYAIQGDGTGVGYLDIRQEVEDTPMCYYDLTANTLYTDTTCEGFFIHEAGNAVTDRIIGRDGTFYSEYLGNTNTQIQSYAEDGCGSKYALTRGLNVRGYTLLEKPFFMSFDTWWNGINPILNLGLGYERLGSPELEVLRVEPKSYFYNKTPSINLDFVNNIERSYDPKKVFKAIEIGFEKWSAESASGVDDPQTRKVYNTRFKTVGADVKILSKFIGASLAIEQTRRNSVEQGKDWRLDEDVMIIAMNLDGSPEFQPELDENFSSVTGLLNAEMRYNIRLSVARNFERWKDYFNGCLQWYISDSPEEEFKFASGEGNFDMTSTLIDSDCEAVQSTPEPAVDEKGNIAVTDDFLFMPIVYTFTHPLTWDEYKTMRDNRNNAIGVSRTDTGHIACFIEEIEYEITHGRANFTVILGENAYL